MPHFAGKTNGTCQFEFEFPFPRKCFDRRISIVQQFTVDNIWFAFRTALTFNDFNTFRDIVLGHSDSDFSQQLVSSQVELVASQVERLVFTAVLL